MFRIGYFQFNPVFGEVRHNLNQVISGLKGARADVIVLPELAFTGYYFKDRDETGKFAETPEESIIVEQLKEFCKAEQFYIVTGFLEKASDKVFNSALLIGPGKLLHIYRKLHLFNTEKNCFDPGDIPLAVHPVRDVRIGIMVCFDWAFPEVARTLALKGADVLCHPSNLVLTHCQQAMRTRSIENRVFTVTANRHGVETRPHGELTFTGQSQITDPEGNCLHPAPADRTRLQILDIDPDLASDKKITAGNDLLRDRRPRFYEPLTADAY